MLNFISFSYQKLTVLLLVLLFCSLADAQTEEALPQNRLFLFKDGSVIKGNLLNDPTADTLKIQLYSGDFISLPKKLLRSIKKDSHQFQLLEDGRKIHLQGIYQQIGCHLLMGYSDEERDDFLTGFGMHYAIGYRFDPLIGLGLGTGIDIYDQAMLPLFVDVRGALEKETLSPYYNLHLGIGFPLNTKSTNLNKAAGLLFYPSIGLLYATKKHHSIHFDVGYKLQKMTRTFDQGWQTHLDRISYRRVVLRLGWEF